MDVRHVTRSGDDGVEKYCHITSRISGVFGCKPRLTILTSKVMATESQGYMKLTMCCMLRNEFQGVILKKKHWITLLAGIFLSISQPLQAQITYQSPDKNSPPAGYMEEAQHQLDEKRENIRRAGSMQGNCSECPAACETVCGSKNDHECLDNLRRERERKFAECRARRYR